MSEEQKQYLQCPYCFSGFFGQDAFQRHLPCPEERWAKLHPMITPSEAEASHVSANRAAPESYDRADKKGADYTKDFRHLQLESFTDAEVERWLFLRATEWANWPSFVSPLFFPILLVVFNWYVSLGILLLANIVWCSFRYAFVSPALSNLGCLIVAKLKFPRPRIFLDTEL
jgi:hypothetical protein